MTEPKKSVTKKPVAEATKPAEATANAPENKTVAHRLSDKIFAKIQAKTGIDNKKVDEWQKKWLALPEHRTKYEHLKNLPDVMGEEIFAMTNDIIDFIQREEGGQSVLFKKIKDSFKDFLNNPIDYLRRRAEEGKKKVMEAKEFLVKESAKFSKSATTPATNPQETATKPEANAAPKETVTKPVAKKSAAKKPAKTAKKNR
jgi:hypothetical protein